MDGLIPLGADPAVESSDASCTPAPVGAAEGLVAALLIALALALTASTAWLAYLRLPYSDAHDWIAKVFATEPTHRWIGYLWSSHGEQRIPIARLVALLDIEVFRGRSPTYFAATAAACGLGLGGGGLLVWRSGASRRLKLWTSVLGVIVLLNVAIAEDVAFPVFCVYLFVAGPALAAMAALHLAPRARVWSTGFVAALVFAVMASLGNAAGLAIWPALVVSARQPDRTPGQMRALLMAALVCICVVEVGLGVPARPSPTPGGSAPAHLLKMVAYFTLYGGLPWTRAIHPASLASLVGLVVEAAAVAAAVRLRPPCESRYASLHSAGAGLIVFGLITAALATVGRVDETLIATAPTRYYPMAALIQLGIVLCCARPLDDRLRRHPKAMPTLLVLGAALALLAQVHAARFLLRTADRIRATSVAFDRGAPPPRDALPIYPDPARAAMIRSEMRAHGLATQ